MLDTEFEQKVAAAGGMENYYKVVQMEELNWRKCELANGAQSLDPNSLSSMSFGDHAEKIQKIENLFSVYDLLAQAGVNVSFIGLTHTMEDYYMNVIGPMKEMLENGAVEDAVALYKQPRHYHR